MTEASNPGHDKSITATPINLEQLRSMVCSQRWFAGKSRAMEDFHLQRIVLLANDLLVALVTVVYADGQELYFVPLAVKDGTLTDGLTDSRFCHRLLEVLAREESVPATGNDNTEAGTLTGVKTALFDELGGLTTGAEAIGTANHDQSNSALTIDNRLFLKIFRKLESGVNPDYEIAHYLTEQGQFTRFPRVAGAVHFLAPGAAPITLATLQELVANEGSAWAAMLATVQTALEADEVKSLERAALLGTRTAELHRALAAESDDPAFAPEPLTLDDCEALSLRLRRESAVAFKALESATMPFPDAIARQIAALLKRGPAMVDQFSDLLAVDPQCTKTRIHGDYHLGQVLCQGGDFIILDFEGEPARSLVERRAKDSPLRDVAGMLRSFGYAAYAGLFATAGSDQEKLTRLEPVAAAWQQAASREFLDAYLATARDAAFLPADSKTLATLLDFFVVEKAIYEVMYELNNRPTWLNIPLAGILAIARSPAP